MSKAFTREDDASEDPVLPPLASLLPPGVKNYLTAGGAERLRGELVRLTDDRSVLLGRAVNDPEVKREVAQLDQRIRYLQQSLAGAAIVDPPGDKPGKVQFGSIVTVRDKSGEESVYKIVGVDEADYSRNEVSWLSPIAKALMNAKVGEKVPFKRPKGATELEILKIE